MLFRKGWTNLEYCKEKYKRKYDKNIKGFYPRYKKRWILSQKQIEKKTMEEMTLGH